MKKLLAIDCSSEYLSIAVKNGDTVLAYHEHKPRQHNELLVPTIQRLLKQAQLSAADLEAIMVGRGPGSFVGVRLAIGVAQGMAFGLDIPVIPLSSMQLIAQSHVHEASKLSVVLDARMGDSYVGEFVREDCIMIPMREFAEKTDQLALTTPLVITGKQAVPRADLAFELLPFAVTQGLVGSAHEAQPIYLRGTQCWQKSG